MLMTLRGKTCGTGKKPTGLGCFLSRTWDSRPCCHAVVANDPMVEHSSKIPLAWFDHVVTVRCVPTRRGPAGAVCPSARDPKEPVSMPQLPPLDRARGCLLGLAIGDALGAPLEGLRRPTNSRPIMAWWSTTSTALEPGRRSRIGGECPVCTPTIRSRRCGSVTS